MLYTGFPASSISGSPLTTFPLMNTLYSPTRDLRGHSTSPETWQERKADNVCLMVLIPSGY